MQLKNNECSCISNTEKLAFPRSPLLAAPSPLNSNGSSMPLCIPMGHGKEKLTPLNFSDDICHMTPKSPQFICFLELKVSGGI